jgi:Arc/MetJ-type ribon-helix-helix transcriptional regulator
LLSNLLKSKRVPQLKSWISADPPKKILKPFWLTSGNRRASGLGLLSTAGHYQKRGGASRCLHKEILTEKELSLDKRMNMAYYLTKSMKKRRLFMPTTLTRSQKSKITVTLSNDLVRQIDKLLESPEANSRSQLVEEAVRRWLRDQAQRDIERQTEEYYLSLSKAEHKEDRQWSKIAARSAKRLWGK